jgi:hypothetical protein
MVTYDPLAFGCSLRAHRLKLGWSAIQLSELYAEFVGREDSPPNPAFVYHIERGTTLVSQQRRAILASLVGMPLARDPDSPMPLDILEYMQALEGYCDQYRQEGTLKQERGAIGNRINQLEAAALQAKGNEKKQLLELLGFYHVIHADTWRGQQPSIVSALLSSSIEIAKQEKLPELLVYALIQRAGIAIGRFESTGHASVLRSALRDMRSAIEEQNNLPALYTGLLYVRCGFLDAYVANDRKAFTAALYVIAEGSSSIGRADEDQRITARLDEELCMLTRASAYLYAPMGDAKLGLAQLEELELAYPEARGKRRLVQRNQLFALAHLAIGDYPLAAAHLEAAIENASQDCIEHLVQIHTQLKNTSYGKDFEVGRLAVKINQMRYAELFL